MYYVIPLQFNGKLVSSSFLHIFQSCYMHIIAFSSDCFTFTSKSQEFTQVCNKWRKMNFYIFYSKRNEKKKDKQELIDSK